jgi:hypothetical protein
MKQSKMTNARVPNARLLALSFGHAGFVPSPGVRTFVATLIANFVEFIRHSQTL